MKTYRIKILVATAIAATALIASARAADPTKGATKQLELIHIETVADVEALKTGDSIAMACAKCKTIWVSKVQQDAKGAEVLMAKGKPVKVIGTHACKGCGTELVISSRQEGKVMTLKHVCKACGDDSAFCCATRKSSGSTKGMNMK